MRLLDNKLRLSLVVWDHFNAQDYTLLRAVSALSARKSEHFVHLELFTRLGPPARLRGAFALLALAVGRLLHRLLLERNPQLKNEDLLSLFHRHVALGLWGSCVAHGRRRWLGLAIGSAAAHTWVCEARVDDQLLKFGAGLRLCVEHLQYVDG